MKTDNRCVRCGLKLKIIFGKYLCDNDGYVYENQPQEELEENDERSYVK